MKYLICQKWEESEKGWGERPDGYSLHTSEEMRIAFIKAYWATMPEEVPDEYSRPSGTPYVCSVEDHLYDSVIEAEKEGKYGVRCFDPHPPGGNDGWLREDEMAHKPEQ